MTKTTKIQIISKNDDILDYKEVNKLLWQLQKESRMAANRCVQLCWEYNNFESDWKKNTGNYPTSEEKKEILGKTLSTIVYNRIKEDAPTMNTGNLSMLNQNVSGRFNSLKADILRGDMSIPSYKKNLPIELHKRNIRLDCKMNENGGVDEWIFELSLFSQKAKKENNLPSGSLKFKAVLPSKSAGSVRAILERCYDEIYEISGSKLKYENGKWFLMLCYSFENTKAQEEKEKLINTMGVHIAEHNAIVCSFSNNKKKRLTIDGGEVRAFSIQIERRKRNIGKATSKHSVLCGDGRVGHGYKTKLEPLEHINNKISNFRNTTNHRYSRQVINWAVKNNCGTIQIEDLNGFATEDIERYTLLKSWSYYDLISKIEYKAKEFGIKVVKIPYKDVWSWCYDCEQFSVEHKKDEEENEYRVCTSCGKVINIDEELPKILAIEELSNLMKAIKTKEE